MVVLASRFSRRFEIEMNSTARISNRRSGRPDLDSRTALISNEPLNAAERLGFQIRPILARSRVIEFVKPFFRVLRLSNADELVITQVRI